MIRMDSEAGLTTYEKAVLRDKEAQQAFAQAHPFGEKLSLLAGLTCLYYPGTKAVVIDIHGGGFCFKSVLDNDAYCAYIQKTFGYAVLNVDFTLSFKKGYPTQILEIVSETQLFLEKFLNTGPSLYCSSAIPPARIWRLLRLFA